MKFWDAALIRSSPFLLAVANRLMGTPSRSLKNGSDRPAPRRESVEVFRQPLRKKGSADTDEVCYTCFEQARLGQELVTNTPWSLAKGGMCRKLRAEERGGVDSLSK